MALRFDELVDEMLYHIVGYLSYDELQSLNEVNMRLHTICIAYITTLYKNMRLKYTIYPAPLWEVAEKIYHLNGEKGYLTDGLIITLSEAPESRDSEIWTKWSEPLPFDNCKGGRSLRNRAYMKTYLLENRLKYPEITVNSVLTPRRRMHEVKVDVEVEVD